MKILMMIVLLGMVSANASADEYDAKAREMFELSNSIEPSIEVMNSMLKAMKPGLMAQLERELGPKGLTSSDIEEIVSEFSDRLVSRSIEELLPVMITELRKHVSYEELTELVELMKEPAFQTYARKIPAIMQTSQQAGQQLGMRVGQEIMLDILSKHPKLQ